MAKTRPSKASKKTSKTSKPTKTLTAAGSSVSSNPHTPLTTIAPLLAQSRALLEASDPSAALPIASHALTLLPTHLPTLELLGELHLELASPEHAYTFFSTAATLDPTGASSGPEKFLWLAQLAPNGGEEAVRHYSTAVEILRARLDADDAEKGYRAKLVSALCGCAELYMSDLCMEAEAEAMCERFVGEALLVDSASIEALTTLASMRVSQSRTADAVAAVERAWETWRVAGAEEVKVQFPVKVALCRIMVETGLLEMAVEAVEELQRVDERLPDLWYLGGWCLFLAGEREKEKGSEGWREGWTAARSWLVKCCKVYREEGWEDEGIWEHAQELLKRIKVEVKGEEPEEGESEAEEDEMSEEEWESDEEDAVMA